MVRTSSEEAGSSIPFFLLHWWLLQFPPMEQSSMLCDQSLAGGERERSQPPHMVTSH